MGKTIRYRKNDLDEYRDPDDRRHNDWDDDDDDEEDDWDDEEDDSAGADFDQFIARVHGMEEHELKLVEIAVAWARGHQTGLPKRKGKNEN